MKITAQEIAYLLQGTIEGNPNATASRPAKIEEATEGTISFLANVKYEHFAYTCQASILLVSKDFQPTQAVTATLVRVEDVYASVALLFEKFGAATQSKAEISAQAAVHPSAKIGQNVSIGAFTVIEEGVEIGDNAVVYPQVYVGKNTKIGQNALFYAGVKIYHGCEIGDNCIIQAGAVIGSDGFGFAPLPDGSYKKIPQLGNVILENNVEVGANTTIDRATMGSTRIGEGVKLDNLIQIAHNVEIGKNTVIAAQTGIAGSTKLGERCMIGGQTGFVGHLKIADGTKTQAQTGIASSVKQPDTALFGYPGIPYNDYLRSYAVFKQLPSLAKQVRELEKERKNDEQEKG
jgi:UDP-3-O-[3-hydroxymyristoyl] glucosamine N-acyltransferase